VQGPQGEYDTHGWWAQQEEAAREEEARRQAAAQAPPDEAGPPEAGPPEAGPPEAGPPEAGPPEAGPPEASAPEAGSPSGRTGTLPNPVITSPGETATSSAHGDRPATSSAPSVPPGDDTLAATEEQGW